MNHHNRQHHEPPQPQPSRHHHTRTSTVSLSHNTVDISCRLYNSIERYTSSISQLTWITRHIENPISLLKSLQIHHHHLQPHKTLYLCLSRPITSTINQTTMSFEEEEAFEHTLLVVREVAVYKIPPRSTSGGYKCGEWLQTDKIWTGRLRVVSCKDRCEIRLEDPNSAELFAACFVLPGQRENSVEPALDSSRYFVLKLEDGTGKHAFIGLGFAERNEAFDFNVALSDHEKYVRREYEKDSATGSTDESQIDIHPAVNHRLKEGETIRINVKNKSASGTGMLSSAGLSGSATEKPKVLLIPPPSGAGKIRSPLPPPPNDPVAARIASSSHAPGLKGPKESGRHTTDPFSDLSQLERNLPSTAGSGSTKGTASGWAAF